MANYIQAENRKTGKPKFFTETGWRSLQNSNIANNYQRIKTPSGSAKNLVDKTKVVSIPKEVLDFKSTAGAQSTAEADENKNEIGTRDFKLFPEGEKGDAAWAAWVTENGGDAGAAAGDANAGAATAETLRAPSAPAGPAAKEPAPKSGKEKGGK
jgi:hypothetical protein